MPARQPKRTAPYKSPFNTLFEEAGETPPHDFRPWDERNDYLRSSVGKDRLNRPEDVTTVARVLTETGDISRRDAALTGAVTPTLEEGVKRLQARAKQSDPNVVIDGVYGPQTQEIALGTELPNARARRTETANGAGNLLVPTADRPASPKPPPIPAATAQRLIQAQLDTRSLVKADSGEEALHAPEFEPALAKSVLDAAASAPVALDPKSNKVATNNLHTLTADNDILFGGEGNDILFGGSSDDDLSESDDVAAIGEASSSADTLPHPAPPATFQKTRPFDKAHSAMDHLTYVVQYQSGTELVRDALDEAAEEAVSALYAPSDSDRPEMVAETRRTLRGLVNLTGDTINWGEWKQFVQRLELSKARLDLGQEVHGLELRRSSDGYDVRDSKGTSIFTLPRFAGQAIAADPKRYGPRLQLLNEALAAENPDTLYDRAAALLHAIAEKEHDIADGTLAFGTAEARAGALITWLKRLQSATTPESQVEAENHIRAALFAEAAPGNRLASFGLDLAPIIGNLRSAEDAIEGGEEVAKALEEGRYADAAGAAFWTALDGIGAVTGIGAGKAVKAAARQTKQGRWVFARNDLARMQRYGQTGLPPIGAEAILGPKYWNRLTEEEKSYLIGLLPSAKGNVAEEQARMRLKAAGIDGERGVDVKEGKGREKTEVEIMPQHRTRPKDPKVRYYDEILDGVALKRFMFFFLKPVRTPGKRTFVEIKAGPTNGAAGQRRADQIVKNDIKKYHANEILLLRMPYDEVSKAALRKQLKAWMQNPKGAGMKRVKGVYETRSGERVVWTQEQLDKLVDMVDKSLARQQLRGHLPTIGSFMTGLVARMAAQADE